MFAGSNFVYQLVPGSGKVAWGDTKMSLGRVSSGVLQRSVYDGILQNSHNIKPFPESKAFPLL